MTHQLPHTTRVPHLPLSSLDTRSLRVNSEHVVDRRTGLSPSTRPSAGLPIWNKRANHCVDAPMPHSGS